MEQQTILDEIWQTTIWCDLSRVSSHGRIVNKNKVPSFGRTIGNGYKGANIMIDGKMRSKLIHRLVAESFILSGPIPSGMVVNHKDGNKFNNNVQNLEVVTPSQNMIHAFKNDLNKNKGETHYKARFTEEQIREIRKLNKEGWGRRRLSKMYGCALGVMQGILNFRTWKNLK